MHQPVAPSITTALSKKQVRRTKAAFVVLFLTFIFSKIAFKKLKFVFAFGNMMKFSVCENIAFRDFRFNFNPVLFLNRLK